MKRWPSARGRGQATRHVSREPRDVWLVVGARIGGLASAFSDARRAQVGRMQVVCDVSADSADGKAYAPSLDAISLYDQSISCVRVAMALPNTTFRGIVVCCGQWSSDWTEALVDIADGLSLDVPVTIHVGRDAGPSIPWGAGRRHSIAVAADAKTTAKRICTGVGNAV
jgi:hypothetical protein